MKAGILNPRSTSSALQAILPKLLLLVFSLLLSFGFGELYLRAQGYAPGHVPRYVKFRPVSQLEVSEHYLADAKLKPDVVAVSFYMLNDIWQSFPMLPHKRIFHVTNAGWLQAYDGNGHYMKPEEAYEIYLAKSNQLFDYLEEDRPTSAAQRLMLKSALGTAVWVRLAQLRSRAAPREPGRTASSPFEAPTSKSAKGSRRKPRPSCSESSASPKRTAPAFFSS